MNSPTSRTLAELRRRGYLAAVVEKFVRFPAPGHRVDLFGCIDVLGLRRRDLLAVGPPLLAIQACAGASHAARAAKVRQHPNLTTVLSCGLTVEVWSWAKQGPRGKRKVWTLREERIGWPDRIVCSAAGFPDAPAR